MSQASTKQLLLTYLDEVLSVGSSKLVGKILKRFELFQDTNVLKKDIKELIYENFREIRDVFIAYGEGLEVSTFKFVTTKKSEEK